MSVMSRRPGWPIACKTGPTSEPTTDPTPARQSMATALVASSHSDPSIAMTAGPAQDTQRHETDRGGQPVENPSPTFLTYSAWGARL